MSADEPIDCQDLVEIITDYLEGVLDADSECRFDEHLRICDGCAAYVEQMRTTLRLLGRIPPETLDSAMRTQLLAAFRDWSHSSGA